MAFKKNMYLIVHSILFLCSIHNNCMMLPEKNTPKTSSPKKITIPDCPVFHDIEELHAYMRSLQDLLCSQVPQGHTIDSFSQLVVEAYFKSSMQELITMNPDDFCTGLSEKIKTAWNKASQDLASNVHAEGLIKIEDIHHLTNTKVNKIINADQQDYEAFIKAIEKQNKHNAAETALLAIPLIVNPATQIGMQCVMAEFGMFIGTGLASPLNNKRQKNEIAHLKHEILEDKKNTTLMLQRVDQLLHSSPKNKQSKKELFNYFREHQ